MGRLGLACVADLARVASPGLSPQTEGAQRVGVGIVAGRLALAASQREQQTFEMMDMRSPNKVTGANSRPASPLDAGRQLGRASCAPPFLSAAVAQF
jgi:hypothetical protein